MHEMGIAQGILEAVVEAAEQEGATRINEVRLSFGDLTEVQESALEFAWEVLRQDTMAADAGLVVERLTARSRCLLCGEEYAHDRYDYSCPRCSSLAVELLQGRELRIDSIDID